MNHEEFLTKLLEHADLVKHKLESNKDCEPIEINNAAVKVVVKGNKNPTLPLIIKKLKSQPRPCPDCGKIVKNRRIDIRVYQTGPVPHYRGNCNICQKTKDPYTGEWTLACSRACSVYAEYYTKKSKLPPDSQPPDK